MQVEFTSLAETDLREIALYIGSDNPQRAITFVLELRAASRGIGDFPRRFEKIADRNGEAVRRRIYGSYAIIYRHNDERTAILRIIHGSKVTPDFIDDLP